MLPPGENPPHFTLYLPVMEEASPASGLGLTAPPCRTGSLEIADHE
jgi:hypothetical protein